MGPVYSFNQIVETRRQADIGTGLTILNSACSFAAGVLARVRGLRGERWGVEDLARASATVLQNKVGSVVIDRRDAAGR